jgi:CRISPR/Cas system-associated protein Cas10 (large subunit of type III CRISPR-Cas system)
MPLFAALVLRSRPIVEDEMRRLDEILKDPPQLPARSRLDPFGSLIKELIDSGWTYRAIARILAEKCGVHASISTIHHFVRRRLKAKRNSPKRQRPAVGTEAEGSSTARTEERVISNAEKKSTEDAVYQRIAMEAALPTPRTRRSKSK